MGFQTVSPIVGDLLEGISQLFICERIAPSKKLREIAQDPLNGFNIARITVDQQFISPGTDADVQKRFQVFDVLILNTEKGIQALRR